MSRIHQRSDKQNKQGQNKPSNRPGKHGQQNGQQANSKMRSGGRRNGRGGKSFDKTRGKTSHRDDNRSHNKSYNLIGVISTTQKGAGYIDLPDKKKESIYLEPGDLNTALNGDTVEAVVTKKMVRGTMSEVGQVLRVISRAREFFVGTVFVEGGKFMVMPDDRKMYLPIVISKEPTRDFSTAHEFRENDKVYVKLKPWLNPSVNPSGEVVRILGQKGVNDVEMESIVLEQGFEIGFPHAVEKEADVIRINKAITSEEISKRRDVRGTLTFTIDPFDAKDFDDAI
ncbi:MAG: hypothetical protein NTZ38_03585, partial [Candidatus Taylorbacteria bacterium]|nr:hypothetical protein [Candidatus Taylorbacteria bacterium]